MTDLLYPHVVAIHRPRDDVQTTDPTPALIVGNVGYSGETGVTTSGDPTGEDVIATGLMASIQFRSPISRLANAVPTDTNAPNVWNIAIPASQTLIVIQERDVVIDESGVRYQIIAVRQGMLAYHMRTEELKRG